MNCFVCKKTLPDKNFSEMVNSMAEYRERFDDWQDEEPVIICDQCDLEIQEAEE